MQKFQKMMMFLRRESMRVPMWIRLTIVGLSVAVSIFWMATFSGVYEWVTLLQVSETDRQYSMTLSFLVSVLFLMLPGLALILLIGQFFPEVDPKDPKANKL